MRILLMGTHMVTGLKPGHIQGEFKNCLLRKELGLPGIFYLVVFNDGVAGVPQDGEAAGTGDFIAFNYGGRAGVDMNGGRPGAD